MHAVTGKRGEEKGERSASFLLWSRWPHLADHIEVAVEHQLDATGPPSLFLRPPRDRAAGIIRVFVWTTTKSCATRGERRDRASSDPMRPPIDEAATSDHARLADRVQRVGHVL